MSKFNENSFDIPKRRGRPKKRQVIEEINASNEHQHGDLKGRVICPVCVRSFPRSKSLRSHIMTHTGVKPYLCTYPLCGRSFIQSGQRKTHYKIHTLEKDYVCPIEGCNVRFAHSNRTCKDHPDEKLRRDNKGEIQYNENHSPLEREWLDTYKRDKSLPPAKRRKTSFMYGTDSADAANIIPGKSSEHANVSSRQYKTFCNAENIQNMGNNTLQRSSSQTEDVSAKRKRTSIISSVGTVSLNSSISTPARPDRPLSDISERSSEMAELSTQVSDILNQHSDWQYGVSCDAESTQNIHRDIVPNYNYVGSFYTNPNKRSESLNQREESTGLFDKSLANSLNVQEIFNSSPKPIRTSVIQSTQRSTNVQTQPPESDVIEAALGLLIVNQVCEAAKTLMFMRHAQ